MDNLHSEGQVLTLTAPSGGVVAGTAVIIGAMLVMPLISADEGDLFTGRVGGAFTVAKTEAQEWAVGDRIYYNTATDLFSNLSTVGPLAGVAIEAAANPSTTGVVRLNATVPEFSEGQQAHIADVAAIAGGESPTEAEHNLVVADLAAIKTALRAVGILASS